MGSQLGDQPAPPMLDGEDVLARAGFTDITVLTRDRDATVYRAVQPALRRTVAVRLQRRPIPDEEGRQRFAQECAVLGRLGGHPNIVQVYGCAFAPGGRPYVIMELPAGGALVDRLQHGGSLSWSQVLEMTVALSGALATAHAAGVVHGHVTVGDVLVSAYGPPQLTGFAAADPGQSPSAAHDVRDLAAACRHALDDRADDPPQVRTLLEDAAAGRISTAEALGAAAQQVQRDLGLTVTPLHTRTTAPPPPRPRWLRPLIAGGLVLLVVAVATAFALNRRAAGPEAAPTIVDMDAVEGQWGPDPALAEQLRTSPDAYLCRDPDTASQARTTQVAGFRDQVSAARVGVVLRDFSQPAARDLLRETAQQAECLEQLPGLTEVTTADITAGDEAVLLRYRRPAAATPVEIVVLMIRDGAQVGHVVSLGYPRTDPGVTEDLRGALEDALR